MSEIADLVAGFDIIAIQEVVAGQGGSQAVIKLVNCLDRIGTKWSYSISSPTSSARNQRERYAYIWKPARVQMVGKAWLEKVYEKEVSREPYLAIFSFNNKRFTAVNFHAIPKSRQPETEIRYFNVSSG